MTGDCHVRSCESRGVRFPPATHLSLLRQPYVIMLTAGGQAADRERAERAGVDEFMTKPFSPSKLIGRVTELLGEPE